MSEEAVAAEDQSPLNLVLSVLGDETASRLRKALSIYVVGAAAVGLSRQTWRSITTELNFTVSVDGSDDIYGDLQAWVLERVPAGRQRSLSAATRRAGQFVVSVPDDGHVTTTTLRLAYDGRRSQVVHVGSHRVRVTVEQENIAGAGNRGDDPWSFRRDRIVFTARGVAARDAVVGVLEELAAQRNAQREVRFFSPRWSEWNRNRDAPLRPLSSVILRAGVAEDVSADLGQFLAREAAYNDLGTPWHRGYLFTGPPGTGKTSLAKALAVEHSLDIYFLPVGSITTDALLLQLLAAVPARSLLLLEDVDIVHGAKKRDDGEPGVSLSGLLNGLDGVGTPHGLVSILTTNDETVLDPALVRPGRIDRKVDLGFLDADQLERLLAFAGVGAPAKWAGRDQRVDAWVNDLTPADVVGVLKDHLGDPEAALSGVHTLIHGPRKRP